MIIETGALPFAAEEDALGAAVERVQPYDLTQETADLLQRLMKAEGTKQAGRDLENAIWTMYNDVQEVAYLLGVAVGRRLGNISLDLGAESGAR